MNEDKILALIPAWNEEAFIGPVIEATRAQLPVLVVDDGSQDGTPDLASSAGAEVVRHEENKGKGQALITGFKWALERGFKAVVTLDADGQHDPTEIPLFLSAYRKKAGELIIGRRDFQQMPFPNRFANPIGSWLLSLALKQRIHDNQCGYRLHSHKLLEALDLKMTGFELEVEVVMQTVCLGMTIGWVPIRTIYGTGKVSYFHPLHDTIGFLKMVWHAYQYRRRFIRRSEVLS
ncbi:MAG TPA: glycosyltransferase family 2 protein [Anaerolineae bacterium]|nr:glycosyltransferase family 2 protein [Anaerolineae bacterium]